MSVALIVAYAERNRVIGNQNKLPWDKLPGDLAYFKKMTVGKTVIIGRKTFESLPKVLPDRTTYILTKDASYRVEHPSVKIFTDIEKCLMMAQLSSEEDVMVAGGGEIYRAFLPYADKVYATIVNGSYDGDATFPELPKSEWETSQENQFASENLDLFYLRTVYTRIKKQQDR